VGRATGRGHYENVEYPATDFAMIARGFGCTGLRVDSPDQVGDALAQALDAEGPTVVDVGIDKWETPELVLRKKRSALRE
jgi:acetolactate synthase-1/2/3 large subunit